MVDRVVDREGNVVYNKDMSIGRRLKAARLAANMTQEQLAIAIGVDDTYISKLENGSRVSAADDVIVRMADVLGIGVDEAFVGLGKLHPELESFLFANSDVLEVVRLMHDGNYGMAIKRINESVARIKMQQMKI